jgi:hypothetical protein
MPSLAVKGAVVPLEVDDQDYAVVRGLKWMLVGDQAVAMVPGGRPMSAVERIFGQAEAEWLDGNKLNMRRGNVLLVTKQMASTSGYKGVSKFVRSRPDGSKYEKWRAVLKVNGKQHILGYADTPEEAHKIYLEKAEAKRQEIVGNDA